MIRESAPKGPEKEFPFEKGLPWASGVSEEEELTYSSASHPLSLFFK